MIKRDVVKLAIEGKPCPYVPWHCTFTVPATERLRRHFGTADIDAAIDNHFVKLGSDIGFFTDLGNDRFRDYFGDDWGQQLGLQMGPKIWREFIAPQLERMYAAVKQGGKYVMIHSCGKVDELFDDLIDLGVDCFNPFQPEVMDTFTLMAKYRGRLAFHGGLSTQRTLPEGSVDDVKRQTQRLLDAGARGDYIFAPAHAVQRDVPLKNMLAFIETLHAQPGYKTA